MLSMGFTISHSIHLPSDIIEVPQKRCTRSLHLILITCPHAGAQFLIFLLFLLFTTLLFQLCLLHLRATLSPLLWMLVSHPPFRIKDQILPRKGTRDCLR
jgi:hypothetical protein